MTTPLRRPDDGRDQDIVRLDETLIDLRSQVTATLIHEAENRQRIESLVTWQQNQNGTLKAIQADVKAVKEYAIADSTKVREQVLADNAALREAIQAEVTQIRNNDIASIRSDIKQMMWWLIRGLLTIVVLFGGNFMIHVMK